MEWADHYTLNMGCGITRTARGVNVDIMPEVNPDLVYDLNKLPFPWDDNTFHRVDMSHIFEHLGDPWCIKMPYYEWFFKFWREVWRILKPRGIVSLIAPVYNHESAWGDPGHVRAIMAQTFLFLSKKELARAKTEPHNPMTRYPINFDFDILSLQVIRDHNAEPVILAARLIAIKE